MNTTVPKIIVHDLDLGAELAAMPGVTEEVGTICAFIDNMTPEERLSVLAVVVSYFKQQEGMDMAKFHALLKVCEHGAEIARLSLPTGQTIAEA